MARSKNREKLKSRLALTGFLVVAGAAIFLTTAGMVGYMSSRSGQEANSSQAMALNAPASAQRIGTLTTQSSADSSIASSEVQNASASADRALPATTQVGSALTAKQPSPQIGPITAAMRLLGMTAEPGESNDDHASKTQSNESKRHEHANDDAEADDHHRGD